MLKRWSVAPFWRPEEGVALALGYDPEAVTIREAYADPQLWVVDDGKHFLELARRAVQAGDLDRNAFPAEFIAWGARVHLIFHQSWHDAIKHNAIEIERRGEFVVLTERAAELYEAEIQRREHRHRLARDWAKASTWTLSDGIALSLDLSPNNSDRPAALKRAGLTAVWDRRLEFARRAVQQGELLQEPTPTDFVIWAAGAGFPFDPVWLDALPDAASALRPDEEASAAEPLQEEAAAKGEGELLGTRERESLLGSGLITSMR